MKKVLITLILAAITLIGYAQTDSNDAYDMLYKKGNSLFESKEFSKAIAFFSEAIDTMEENTDLKLYFIIGRAGCKFQLFDYRGCIADCNKAIKMQDIKSRIFGFGFIKSEMGNCYAFKGFAEAQLHDMASACLDWSKAGELGYEKAYDLIKESCR